MIDLEHHILDLNQTTIPFKSLAQRSFSKLKVQSNETSYGKQMENQSNISSNASFISRLINNNSNLPCPDSFEQILKQCLNALESKNFSCEDSCSSSGSSASSSSDLNFLKRKYTLSNSYSSKAKPIRDLGQCECSNNWTISVIPSLRSCDEMQPCCKPSNTCCCERILEKINELQKNVPNEPDNGNTTICNNDQIKRYPCINDVVTQITSKEFYSDYKNIISLLYSNESIMKSKRNTKTRAKSKKGKPKIGMDYQYL